MHKLRGQIIEDIEILSRHILENPRDFSLLSDVRTAVEEAMREQFEEQGGV